MKGFLYLYGGMWWYVFVLLFMYIGCSVGFFQLFMNYEFCF